MKNNNYVLYYKTNENDYWHSVRPDLPIEQWEDYAKEYWVKEYGKFFDTDFGKFKFAIECLGLELSDKMTDKEYKKTHRR